MVQQCVERFRQKQMKLDKLTQSGWEDVADYFGARDMKNGTSEFRVPAVVKPETHDHSLSPAPTTCGEFLECVEIVPGISRMLQGTF